MKNNTFQLIDTAKVKIRAGSGGDGRVSFRHEKYIPRGGPDGGDGGNGGSVYFVADNNSQTLLDFRSKSIFAAKDGEMGGKKNMSGSNSEDLYIKVPLGTLMYEEQDNKRILVADMIVPGVTFLAARGGRGGKGNFRFRSSVNQAPLQYTAGTQGEEKTIGLEIKLVADVGLIGFPNAGKSTLLNALTHANVKVSNYPFTTLNPNLGTLKTNEGEIIFADIPGLIEGASQGKGLGDEFLRHVERTRMLIHLIDPSDFSYTHEENYTANALRMYDILRQELKLYKAGLEKKKEIIAITKMDITEVKENFENIREAFKNEVSVSTKKNVIGVSGATGEGLKELINMVLESLSKLPKAALFESKPPVKTFNINNLPNKRLVFNNEVKLFEGDKKI